MTTFKLRKITHTLVSSGLLVTTLGISLIGCTSLCRPCVPRTQTNTGTVKNPTAKKNPCVPNPGSTNPCAGKKVNPTNITRPANYRPYQGNQADLRKYGKNFYNDTNLSTNGRSCQSCHQDGSLFRPTFMQPYPHFVAMARDLAGLSQIELDEMVQLCMIASMEAKPLMWNSRALAALTIYTTEIQQALPELHSNPGRSRNPCAIKDPRRTNPDALKNPCALRQAPISER